MPSGIGGAHEDLPEVVVLPDQRPRRDHGRNERFNKVQAGWPGIRSTSLERQLGHALHTR